MTNPRVELLHEPLPWTWADYTNVCVRHIILAVQATVADVVIFELNQATRVAKDARRMAGTSPEHAVVDGLFDTLGRLASETVHPRYDARVHVQEHVDERDA